jgi:hypothetical protein
MAPPHPAHAKHARCHFPNAVRTCDAKGEIALAHPGQSVEEEEEEGAFRKEGGREDAPKDEEVPPPPPPPRPPLLADASPARRRRTRPMYRWTTDLFRDGSRFEFRRARRAPPRPPPPADAGRARRRPPQAPGAAARSLPGTRTEPDARTLSSAPFRIRRFRKKKSSARAEGKRRRPPPRYAPCGTGRATNGAPFPELTSDVRPRPAVGAGYATGTGAKGWGTA